MNLYPFSHLQPNRQTGQYVFVNSYPEVLEYPVPVNSSIILMDSTNPIFYSKSTNHMGQAIIKKYKFEEIPIEDTSSNYVTKEQFNELTSKIDMLINNYKKE